MPAPSRNLTPEAIEFVATLHREYGETGTALLAARLRGTRDQ